MDPEIARKNVRLGIVLFAIAAIIIGATIAAAFIYNSVN